MENEKICFRSIMLYEFKRCETAVNCSKNICEAFGDNIVTIRMCQRWFKKFRDGDFDLCDKQRSGRPQSVDDNVLKQMVKENPRQTSRELAERLSVDHTTVLDHLHKLKMVSKLEVWVPHELTQKNLVDRYTACVELLSRNENDPFLNRIVTGDEKWVLYNNVKRKRYWSEIGDESLTIAKPNRYSSKIMLCCWWDCKGVLYYELLKPGETINSELYCQQLDKLNDAIKIKRPSLINKKGVIFHQDNARPHVAIKTQAKIKQLGYEILTHPPYSPDIAPSDYYLFRCLQNHLNGKKLNSFDDVKTCIDDFFQSKPTKFYEKGINKLVERWRTVINNNGNYVVDK